MSTNSLIKLKRSSVEGKIPTTENLQLGEIALNTFDGKLFIKKDDGVESIVSIGEVGWSSFATQWDTPPTLFGSISGATVYTYTLDGVTRYRRVPEPYDASQDTFFADMALTQPIVSRGGQ